jgi:phosphatidylglycerol---prolipoprotein diacylglyceryl transferase
LPKSKSRKRARRPAARPGAAQRHDGAGHPGVRTPAPPAPPGGAHGETAAAPAAGGARQAVPGEESDQPPGWAERALQEVLTPTFWFDPGQEGEPYRATVRFSGRREGVSGKPKPGDAFTREVIVEEIVPGSGPVAVTAEIRDINPSGWDVTARSAARAGTRTVRPSAPEQDEDARRQRSPLWPRRVTVPATSRATLRTASLPFAKVPGIIRFAYTGLVLLGVLAGLAVQALLLARARLPVAPALAFSAGEVAGGVAGAKAWYIAVHRARKFDGWCIQGFVTGAAAVAAAVPAAGLGLPAGSYYAAAAPGLLIGMAIGRPGCFWGGCCVGRPTASRWGIWSSDRIVGCRRMPAQLLEAALALLAGLAALVTVLLTGPGRSWPVAVAALAAYTLGRQFILDLRADPPRRLAHGRLVTAVAATAVLVASIALLGLGVT